jgi:hypothetical protein
MSCVYLASNIVAAGCRFASSCLLGAISFGLRGMPTPVVALFATAPRLHHVKAGFAIALATAPILPTPCFPICFLASSDGHELAVLAIFANWLDLTERGMRRSPAIVLCSRFHVLEDEMWASAFVIAALDEIRAERLSAVGLTRCSRLTIAKQFGGAHFE